jgi:hypothetical protein
MRTARVLATALAVLSLVAVSSASSAAQKAPKAKNQVLSNAVVKTVSADSITVTAAGKDSTFSVDPKTKVTGKGMGTKSAAKGGKATLADLLKEGDRVTVTYQDMGGMMHASRVEVAAATSK